MNNHTIATVTVLDQTYPMSKRGSDALIDFPPLLLREWHQVTSELRPLAGYPHLFWPLAGDEGGQ